LLVMRADNHGEGGILALMSLTGARWRGREYLLVAMGLFGAALIYGDGIITPAISVLSALEGLNVATDVFPAPAVPRAAPRHRAHRSRIRSHHAAVVCGDRRTGRGRHHPAPERLGRRQPGACNRASPRK